MRRNREVLAGLLALVCLWAGLECGYRIGRAAEMNDHRLYVRQVVRSYKGDK